MTTTISIIAICLACYVVYQLYKDGKFGKKEGSTGGEVPREKDNPNDQTMPRA